jgi:hypothetical protein
MEEYVKALEVDWNKQIFFMKGNGESLKLFAW